MMLARPRAVFASYSALLAKRPIQTKTATSFCIAACGDLVVQRYGKTEKPVDCTRTEKPVDCTRTEKPVDCTRTVRQASFSMLIAPAAHAWFGFLARLRLPIAVAVAVDQLTFAPTANILYLAWSHSVREGSVRGCEDEIRAKLWPALQASYLVWPAAMTLNFAVVPLQYRVLFTNAVGFGYGAFMTSLANDSLAQEMRQ